MCRRPSFYCLCVLCTTFIINERKSAIGGVDIIRCHIAFPPYFTCGIPNNLVTPPIFLPKSEIDTTIGLIISDLKTCPLYNITTDLG